MDKNNSGNNGDTHTKSNREGQGVDKAPGEEIGKGDQVTNKDLKGKKVDADPELESDKPMS